MSREPNLSQISFERLSIEQQTSVERGVDEVIASPNPGVIVVPAEQAHKFPLGLSGSLTKLVDGSDYLVAGSSIELSTGSNGSITISAQSVAAGGLNSHVQFNDGGTAFGGDPAFVFNKTTDTLSVMNISGSLTKLVDGSDYLLAGHGITLLTGSNGSITVGSSLPTWYSYVPTITAPVSNPILPTAHNLHGRYIVQGKVMTLIFNFSGASSTGAQSGNGNYVISLPGGYSIDTTLISLGTSEQNYLDGTPVGTASLITDSIGSGGAWSIVPNSPSSVVLLGQNPTLNAQPITWGSSNYSIGSANSYRISFAASIPLA